MGASSLGLGGVGDGEAGVGVKAFPLAGVATAGAVMTEEGKRSLLAPTVVTAQPRRRRQWRLPAVAAVLVGVGMLQDTGTTWRPAAWLNTTCAFSPLAMQHSCCTALKNQR
jgi:hypothetical protein